MGDFFSDSQARALCDKLKQQGWRVERTKRTGHIKFIPPSKDAKIIYTSGTPSDFRTLKNLISDLKKSGARL